MRSATLNDGENTIPAKFSSDCGGPRAARVRHRARRANERERRGRRRTRKTIPVHLARDATREDDVFRRGRVLGRRSTVTARATFARATPERTRARRARGDARGGRPRRSRARARERRHRRSRRRRARGTTASRDGVGRAGGLLDESQTFKRMVSPDPPCRLGAERRAIALGARARDGTRRRRRST